MEQNNVVLALDMGGSKYMGGLVDERGEILYKQRWLWESYDLDRVLAGLCGAIDDALAHSAGHTVRAIGMTIPGLADPHNGVFVDDDVLLIRDWPIGRILRERYGLPVYLDNDGRACALAEHTFGAAQGCEHFLYITVSNGVGGALFLNGDLYYGARGNAGEIGQCIVETDAASSRCGRAGTLEELANAAGIVANYLYLGGSPTIDGAPPSGKSIDALARAGDPIALQTYELEGYYLGRVIADVYNCLNIERVVIGGGLSLGFDLFEQALLDSARAGTFSRNHPHVCVVPTPLRYEGALIGAASLALRGLDANA